MIRCLLLAALVLLPLPAAAQQLALKRDPPKVAWTGCPVTPQSAVPDREQQAEAERLADLATEATILGNSAGALDLLGTAARLDPASERLAYRHARILEELERGEEAITEYCRYLRLAPRAADVSEVQQRIARLVQAGEFAVPAPAAEAFRAGIAHYDARRLTAAEAAFGEAASALPSWSDPVYNRAVVRLALGKRSAATADFRRYLEMNPGSGDVGPVLELIGATPARPPFNPATALASGLVVPGLGQFTTGRPAKGALLLAGAAAAVTTGVLTEHLKVDCLSVPVDGRCPPDQIQDERRERPLLLPGIGVAAAIGIYGAIDAYLFARRRNAQAAELLRIGGADGAGGVSVALPSLHADASGARLDLLRLRF
ncbi:MAG TPA: hypothetical protein VK939_05420 [Longimicrobiales bacterium]|nr:hypothetical protein [Longimicrobiales bacterium]